MRVQDLVLNQRTEILRVLCSSGSAEPVEHVTDILLSQGELTWEDYQSIHVSGRPLYTNARQLLDVVYLKGESSCGLFLEALKQVLPEEQPAGFSFPDHWWDPEVREECQNTFCQTLLTQRPSLVSTLQHCVDGALEALLTSAHFTSADCEGIRLPLRTPSQQARCLLDHVRAKGEAAAKFLLEYIQQGEESGSILNKKTQTVSREFLKFQKKLRSSLSAQSCFLSTYGGTSHMSLDDIYTDGQLELAEACPDVHGPIGLKDITGEVGMINEEADTVLVSGEAGSGKSTLLQRLHLLWAREAALLEYLLLFPFSCRRLNTELSELSFKELLFQHCCWPDRDQDEIFDFIQDHPHLILFTFDGLDELKQSFSDEHRLCCPTQRAPVHVLLFNLIQGSLLKGVRKVVTSRPSAVTPVLKKNLCKEVLLKGFSPSGIDCFVRKHHSDPTVAAKVLQSLHTNTTLLGLCHSPVLCWIVSCCHKELLGCGEGSPQTITDVYLTIVEHFFQHHSPLRSTGKISWHREYLDPVLRLGQLAFKGIVSTCYIFSDKDLDPCAITKEDLSLGFLIQSKDLSVFRSKCYEFLHVTMQCFFAAVYVVVSKDLDRSTIPKLFELKNLKETSLRTACFSACLLYQQVDECSLDKDATAVETPNLQMTATFASGLLSQRHRSLWLHCCPATAIDRKTRQVSKCLSKGMQKHFKSIPQPVAGEKKSMHAMPGFVWLIKCIYEMQECSIAKDAMSKLEVDHLKLTYCNIGPVECTALAFVLQHLNNPVGLQLDNNTVGDVGVEQLLPCMHICHSLYLRNNNITDEGIHKLIAKSIQCDNFHKIALFNNRLTDACTQDFSLLLKTKQDFISLRLGNNNITAEGAKQLAEGLRVNKSLKFLGLWGNSIGDAGAEALASALEGNTTLVWLSLVGNGIGSAGACALSKVVKNNVSLEELWLTENCITRMGVECLIEALQHNANVKSIWLRNNDLCLEEVEEMAQRESRLLF
ncbi:nucleotide-binding oligomerization domain-containing protein 2 isoform X1 [Takifugu rubripes]|uniref:nucleotide-binding oligomerization domain-containing protein 2 isoform X1 n=1 Tax=Takifugu rubripes TaxID=31033 RepID=UPI00114558B4|nr:nucleotide-binding oligomerization domain-containing protein 2 isoform X1 [Takifugu rubripes]XP_029701512.1 nucleotide-binding oligomerization domain-containing protein 2 isoform X1 [Takifugu rubripes]